VTSDAVTCVDIKTENSNVERGASCADRDGLGRICSLFVVLRDDGEGLVG
jgi:hypothetical protein